MAKFARKWRFVAGLNEKNRSLERIFAMFWVRYFNAKRPVFRA